MVIYLRNTRVLFRKFLNLVKRPELRILPGQLAFFLTVSLIPLFALVGAVSEMFNLSTTDFIVAFSEQIPEVVRNMMQSAIYGQGMNANMALFFIFAFILTSNGTHSMIITANEIYKIENKNVLYRRVKAIFMMFMLLLLFLFLLIVPVFGDSIFDFIKSNVSDVRAFDFFYRVFMIFKYPISVLILFFNIKLIYVISPDSSIESSSTTKGALFTTFGWIIASSFYSIYIGVFDTYNIYYGSISSILVLLLWVYVLSYIFVLGLIINASSYDL